MAFQPVPDVLECVISGRLADAQTFVNVFHFPKNGLTDDQTTANTLATFFDTAYTTLAAFMSTDWHVDNLQLYALETQGSPAYNAAITVVGTGSGAPLPNQIALCVSWATDLRGKWYRGRTYLSGWTEAASDGNGPTSGAVAAAINFADEFLPGSGIGVVSRVYNKAPRAEGIFTPITTARVDAVWDTMRTRRLPGT